MIFQSFELSFLKLKPYFSRLTTIQESRKDTLDISLKNIKVCDPRVDIFRPSYFSNLGWWSGLGIIDSKIVCLKFLFFDKLNIKYGSRY